LQIADLRLQIAGRGKNLQSHSDNLKPPIVTPNELIAIFVASLNTAKGGR
jgi:hypothetical protein